MLQGTRNIVLSKLGYIVYYMDYMGYPIAVGPFSVVCHLGLTHTHTHTHTHTLLCMV